jgi:hypothetical protein
MRNGVGLAVIIGAILIGAFVLGATFFEPKHEGPFEKVGEKVDKTINR